MKTVLRHLGRIVGLLLLSAIGLQLYFLLRVAMMTVVDPQSTSYQRSEMFRLLKEQHQILWAQSWVPDTEISDHLKRAVIASEDAGFSEHNGVEWEAIEKAMEKNQLAEARAVKQNERAEKLAEKRAAQSSKAQSSKAQPVVPKRVQPKVVGASTISQQLAKNLFLASERNFLRKGQELVITFMLEGLLPKRRILEIYLNNVEWGEGLFGAEAASRHYFHVDAARLDSMQAARLAVMLPGPKLYEKRPGSNYLIGRAYTVRARMGDVALP
jgi:monofunctional biosynthetic peptidoglycan transglycosylase